MSTGFKSFKFSVGENPVRVYEGSRINPRDGIELGYDLAGLLSEIWDGLIEGETKCAKRKQLPISDDETQNKTYDFITLYTTCYEKLDKRKYLALFDKVMEKTTFLVKRDDGKEIVNLRANDESFDTWFSEFPQDLAFFTAAVLVENAAPFLPERWRKALKPSGLDTTEGLKKLF